MTRQTPVGEAYVKRNTLIVVSLVTFAVGFIGGVVLSAYKSSSMISAPASMPAQQGGQQQTISAEQAQQIRSLEEQTAKNPQDADSWIQLGHLYFDTHQPQKAIQSYEKSLALKPDNADVLTDLGVMYRRSGNPEKAIESFDRAMQVDPRHEISRFNKGIVLMHDLNDLKGAVKAWEELLAINPTAKTPSGMPIRDMLKRLKKTAGSPG